MSRSFLWALKSGLRKPAQILRFRDRYSANNLRCRRARICQGAHKPFFQNTACAHQAGSPPRGPSLSRTLSYLLLPLLIIFRLAAGVATGRLAAGATTVIIYYLLIESSSLLAQGGLWGALLRPR